MSVDMLHGRRQFLAMGVGGATALALGTGFWTEVIQSGTGSRRRAGPGYGRLARPDENGIRLPPGFRSREVARGKRKVAGTGYSWHVLSDGAATFPTRGGGWILVSNSEAPAGGASAIRFDRNGRIADAYRILDGTTQNCSGGGTPWGTWLSCEETEGGFVWECDPTGRRGARRRPALGAFKHEAAAVDRRARVIYLTEDLVDGGFYRFTPRRWPDLREGSLEIAQVGDRGQIAWHRVPDPSARRQVTRRQVPQATSFKRAEGLWLDGGTVYISTTADSRVLALDVAKQRVDVIYDGFASREAPLLRVDQLTGSRAGELFVCEDIHTEEIDLGLIEPSGRVSRFLTVTGPQHHDSELTGAAFDPSGRRLYLSSQRAHGHGVIYEITGPFRGARRSRGSRGHAKL